MLLKAGADPNKTVNMLPYENIVDHLGELMAAGAPTTGAIATIAESYRQYNSRLGNKVTRHCPGLLKNGVEVDKMLKMVSPQQIQIQFKEFLEAGINPNLVMKYMDISDVTHNIGMLAESGVDIEELLDCLNRHRFGWWIEERDIRGLLSAGVDPDRLAFDVLLMRRDALDEYVEHFLGVVTDINRLAESVSPGIVIDHIKEFRDRGAVIDIRKLLSRLGQEYGVRAGIYAEELVKEGLAADDILNHTPGDRIPWAVATLQGLGMPYNLQSVFDSMSQ